MWNFTNNLTPKILEQLREIKGFYKYDKRNKYIFINNNLDDSTQKFVCTHEFGHSQIHPRVNTPFLRKNTFFSTDCEVSASYRVPEEVIQLKIFLP